MTDADHQSASGDDSGTVAPAARVPTHIITIPTSVPMVTLLGPRDELLRTIERAFPLLDVHVRGNEISLRGASPEVALVERLIDELLAIIDVGQPLNRDAVERSIAMLRSQTQERPADVLTMNIVSNRGRTIRPKTLNQKRYVDAIDRHTVVFGIGPAGTGKTYLAMAKAVAALQAKQVNRIILTRPAVEAGERLGFLPGTLSDKIDPYLRPLYDALHDMLDPESIPRLMAAGTIEVAPLAYMRGRAQPLDAQVLTPAGFRPIGSLRVGDLVVGSDGRPTPVVGVYPQGPKDVYRLSTQDGASTLCCGEHLWTVATGGDRRRGRTSVVQTQDMLGRLRQNYQHRFELPLARPVELVPRPVPTDPYALGLRLGDACLPTSAPAVTSAPTVAAAGLGLAGARGATLDHGRRGDVAVAEATSITTCVPVDYLVNSADVRLAVLQGLLDADGAPKSRLGRGLRVRYTTVSPRLRDDVVYLVRSLGGVACWRRRLTVRRPRDTFVVDIRLPEGVVPFRLDARRARYTSMRAARPARFVHDITPVGRRETVCIQVAAADSLYVTDDFLVTHNTLNDAFIILDEAQNTSAEQMKMFLTRLGFGSKMVVTGDVTQVDLPAGTTSGLRQVREILLGIDDVHFTELTSADVVRHRLVSAIVDAYDRSDATRRANDPGRTREARHRGPRQRPGEPRTVAP